MGWTGDAHNILDIQDRIVEILRGRYSHSTADLIFRLKDAYPETAVRQALALLAERGSIKRKNQKAKWETA